MADVQGKCVAVNKTAVINAKLEAGIYLLVYFFNSGGSSGAEPPFSIPNKEVKRTSAEDTIPVAERENRSLPEHRTSG